MRQYGCEYHGFETVCSGRWNRSHWHGLLSWLIIRRRSAQLGGSNTVQAGHGAIGAIQNIEGTRLTVQQNNGTTRSIVTNDHNGSKME
jgi:hypothetical protein